MKTGYARTLQLDKQRQKARDARAKKKRIEDAEREGAMKTNNKPNKNTKITNKGNGLYEVTDEGHSLGYVQKHVIEFGYISTETYWTRNGSSDQYETRKDAIENLVPYALSNWGK